jgi:malonyl-CoA/methylmalonyl-CoA synthetase
VIPGHMCSDALDGLLSRRKDRRELRGAPRFRYLHLAMPSSPLLARWLEHADDPRTLVREASGQTSWRAAIEAADRVAGALLEGRRSLEGERVALLVAPGAEFVASFFGVLRAGGCVVVLSPLHPTPETAYFCADAGVRTIVASPSLVDRVAMLSPERRVVTTTDVAGASRAAIPAEPRAGDPALQLYTSGTTGKPKGAVITHANLATQQDLVSGAWGWTEDDVLLHALPLHHLHGLGIAWLTSVRAGAATHFLGGFDAGATWEAMPAASVFMGVPTVHARLLAALDAADEGTRQRWVAGARALRVLTSGSAALPVTIGERWRELTGAYPLERFGMTEIGVGMSNPLAPGGRRPGSVGLPLPTVRTRVAGDDGGDAAEGELLIAGPSVFAGYHERPEANRDAFVDRDGERWFKTGDTVSRDADGYFRILGRTSVDILKSGGYKLSALEIEEALRECPAIAEVAVVGVKDETWGERVVACVVPHAGREDECALEPLRAFAKERLAPYKVPKDVVLMRDLPRNAVGKVVKPELMRQLAARGG